MNLQELLSRGYFPRELPPPFTTESFASLVCDPAVTLPRSLTHNRKSSHHVRHEIPNIGLRRRSLSIPNPVLYYELARNIANNWNVIQAHCNGSPFSKSMPTFNNLNGRAIVRSFNETELLPLRSRLRALAKYILRTDISRFYPSVYSHSIPWALHSKSTAKARRGDRHMLGNILDTHVRNAQDGQTIGIPIGPDSSLVIAEIILSAQDQLLHSVRSDLQMIRYVDDFEIAFGTYTAAEEGLALLRSTLKEYELEINAQKTEIIELPIPLNPTWIAELSACSRNRL